MILKDRTAVVTGAAGTLGIAAARALLEDGAQVALVDIDALRLDGMVRFLRGATLAVACDVSDAGAVRQAHQQVEKVLGPIDVVVNAAAVASPEKLDATPEAEWRRVLAVNLDGAFHWARTAMPGMKQRGWGRLVNVAPVSARGAGIALAPAEAAAHGALRSLTASLAREAAPFGITVNVVAPWYVQTPSVAQEMNDQQRRQLLARIPAGRFCEPEEVAHAVRFLVSPLAGFVTGQDLVLDGGSGAA